MSIEPRAIADMARSLDLPEEIKAKLDNPRSKVFTTIERVIDSSIGRQFLKIKRDPQHGIRGTTTKKEFIRGFTKLVSDIALGKESSRTLNKNDDIQKYFEKLDDIYIPKMKRGSFVPSDIIKGKSISSPEKDLDSAKKSKKQKKESKTILPKDLKIRFRNDRLIDIKRELVKLKRDEFPNSGAIMLRVFFELAVVDYLERIGELSKITNNLRRKNKPIHLTPSLKDLLPKIREITITRLPKMKADKVEKALRYDSSAPFTIADLNAFVHHSSDPPSARDIWQFWLRTEPLFRLMLEQDIEGTEK